MLGQTERINIHDITLSEPGLSLPFDAERDITQKDWGGILKASEGIEDGLVSYKFVSNIKTLSYERYKQIKIKPVEPMDYRHFVFKRYPYSEVVNRLELVVSLKDLFNIKLWYWQESRLFDQFIQHRRKGDATSRLRFLNLGREALRSRIKISEYQDVIYKQEWVTQLNNNFDPKNLGWYMNYVSYANLFGTEELTYKPNEETWKAMRTYLDMSRGARATYRDWDDFVEFAALFKTFTAYTTNDVEHALPEMRHF